jgi:hypothetical protein
MFTVYKLNHDGSLSNREELNNLQELESHLANIKYNTIKVVKTSVEKTQELLMIRNPMTECFETYEKSEVVLND